MMSKFDFDLPEPGKQKKKSENVFFADSFIVSHIFLQQRSRNN